MIAELILLVLGCNAALLAWCDNYDDGFIGRIALGAIVLGVAMILIGQWSGEFEYEFPLEITIILGGVALFLMRHTRRWRLALRRRRSHA